MTRRTFLATPAMLAAQNARPNIVMILADDLGSADLSSYGATDIRTPNIDAIGKQGLRFRQAYCNAPECTPSRTALLTGRYQHRVGGMECALGVGNVGRYDEAIWLRERDEMGLPASEITIAKMLKQQGYDTACIGKWHLGYGPKFAPNAHGFDRYFGILGGGADYYQHTEEDGLNVLYEDGKAVKREGYLTDLIGDEAVRWVRGRRERPYFLYVPFNAPHAPFQSARVRKVEEGGWNRGTRQTYVEMVEALDRQVGNILAAVDPKNTWVIFMSDNGGTGPGSNKPLRGAKSSVWEGGIRMPCLMRWPGMFTPGSETAQVTLMMDVTASILAAPGVKLDLKPARKLDGEDLLAEWQGKRPLKSRTVFWRYRRANNTRKAIRHGDWKLVDDNGKQELHNIATDPNEQRDQLMDQPKVAADLRVKLAAWETEVRAPRLKEFYERR